MDAVAHALRSRPRNISASSSSKKLLSPPPSLPLRRSPMANTPAHAGDDTINALVELEHEVVYLRSVPADDWQIDIDDDGAMTGRCPCCGCKDISYVTPEWLECLGCGHKDGQK